MKRKPILLLTLSVLVLVALFAACGTEPDHSKPADKVLQSTSGVTVYQMRPAASGSELPSGYGSVAGTLEEQQADKIYLRTDGEIIEFTVTDADLSDMGDGVPGDKITVFYKGTFNGKDERGLQVIAVVDTAIAADCDVCAYDRTA